MSKINSTLKFKNYIVDTIEYKVNLDYNGEEREIDFDIESSCNLTNNEFILELDLKIYTDAKKNNYPFSMRVKVVGLFEVTAEKDEIIKKEFSERNSIAILFPYVRALVTTFTSNANVSPLILPPINVIKYMEEKNEKKKKNL